MGSDWIQKEIDSCRVCGSKLLIPILSLGKQYVSNFVEKIDKSNVKIPLELVLCDNNFGGCGLLQLKHTTNPDIMYKQYWYMSGINKTMTDALKDIVEKIEKIVEFNKNDIVLDIGCNDGTLLRSYSKKLIRLVGIDPAKNMEKFSKIGTTKIIVDYFSSETFHKEFPEDKAKIITSIAMFYDLDNPNKFVSDIKQCLHDDGMWIIQMSYLPSMLEQNAFDNICHEHVCYYSLLSLENLLCRHDFVIFDVDLNDINGGSFRAYIKHKNGDVKNFENENNRMKELREYEKSFGLASKKVYEEFAKRVEGFKKRTLRLIRDVNKNGGKLYAYGASTKGNTLLQYYDLNNSHIIAVAERNPMKYGKKTIGSWIPIISEQEVRKAKPEYLLVLPWHFFKEFGEREREFLQNGGKFILPLPVPKIVTKDYEKEF
ncbi:class I SAM-dependent methyltransferase [Candidatus Woesearchaeota archaeon]|nr:class I SAM-dependent methyltransferase [Candidatus Woesearchaeota archaeon]